MIICIFRTLKLKASYRQESKIHHGKSNQPSVDLNDILTLQWIHWRCGSTLVFSV